MKKLLLLTLLFASSAFAATQDYPDRSRFVYYNVNGTPTYILKDTKTGCEYVTLGSYSSFTLVEGSCTVQK